MLLVTEPKAEGAGGEPAENNGVDSDPKLGVLCCPEPGLGPNAGNWLAPKAGPAAGAAGPEPNRNEDDDPWGQRGMSVWTPYLPLSRMNPETKGSQASGLLAVYSSSFQTNCGSISNRH